MVPTLGICVKKKKDAVFWTRFGTVGKTAKPLLTSVGCVCVHLTLKDKHTYKHTHTVKVPSYQWAEGTFVVAETSVLQLAAVSRSPLSFSFSICGRPTARPLALCIWNSTQGRGYAGRSIYFPMTSTCTEFRRWPHPPSPGPNRCKDNVSPDLFALLLSQQTPSPPP